MGQKVSITCDVHVPQLPGRVWQALTEPRLVAAWWAAGDIQPVVGHRFTLDMGPWGNQPCQVVKVEPGRILSYTFAEGSLDTRLTWRIEAEGDGCRLFLEHSGFDLDSPAGRQAYEGMGKGWPGVIAGVDAALRQDSERSSPDRSAGDT